MIPIHNDIISEHKLRNKLDNQRINAFAAMFNGETKAHKRGQQLKHYAEDDKQFCLFANAGTSLTVDGELLDHAQNKMCDVKAEVIDE